MKRHCQSIVDNITTRKEKNIKEDVEREMQYIKNANSGWFRNLFTSFKEPEDYDYAYKKLCEDGLQSSILFYEMSNSEQLSICKSLLKNIQNTTKKTIKINEYQKEYLNL